MNSSLLPVKPITYELSVNRLALVDHAFARRDEPRTAVYCGSSSSESASFGRGPQAINRGLKLESGRIAVR